MQKSTTGIGLMTVALIITGCGAVQSKAVATSSRPVAVAASPSVSPSGPTVTQRTTASRTATPVPGRQLVTVTASSYGATEATFVAYEQVGSKWKRVLGPWTAHVGRNGIAAPGTKREGDLHTPSGTYGFSFMFGTAPDPGVSFRYRVAHSYDTWSDDSTSSYYNEWVDSRYHSPGASPEAMDGRYYKYGVVIAYNTARTPMRGSAVFLHVDHASPTTGCVTLPTAELLSVMRWLNPARSPQIQISVR